MSGRGRSGGVAVLLVAVVICAAASLGEARGDVARAGTAVTRVAPAAGGDSRDDVMRAGAAQADTLAGVLQAIDACILKLNPDVDIGYARVAARCPALVRRVGESGVSAWLPRDWQRAGNDLSVGGLRELRGALARELGVGGGAGSGVAGAGGAAGAAGVAGAADFASERGRLPSVEHVHEVLASLAQSDGGRSSWWTRAKAWLRSVFARDEQATEEGWLARMVGESGLSQTVIELISYVALALVAVLAVVIVVNELRVGGVFGGPWRRRAVLAAAPVALGRGGLTWDDVQKAPAVRRVGLVLELLVTKLGERSRLRAGRGLTVRELTLAAQLGDEGDRERLLMVARVAERVRFGGSEVSGVEVAAAVESGRGLLERIGAGDSGAAL
jgi:hypothetical protein